MKRAKETFARPHRFGDFEFVRAGPDGACWTRTDGMVVRIAAAEAPAVRHPKVEWRHTPHAEWEVALGRSGVT